MIRGGVELDNMTWTIDIGIITPKNVLLLGTTK